jgi:hypothetical protein
MRVSAVRTGRSTIEASKNIERPELSSEESAARELANRIKKLRWMGMEKEAKSLQATLARMSRPENVLLLPANTD